MAKHLVFLMHGIGAHTAAWADAIDGPINGLRAASSQYSSFQRTPLDDRVEFVPIHYDGIFQAAVQEWQNDARFLQQHDPTGNAGGLLAWMNNASATDSNFWWTNVCDLVLYRLSHIYRQRVRSHVLDQIAQRVEAEFQQNNGATCSILAHSMGTAVAHDCVHLLGTVRWGGHANPLAPKHWRFDTIMMVANTSRLLQTEDAQMKRAYESIVRPGPRGEESSYCRWFLNFRHEGDFVPFPRMFEPEGWRDYESVVVRHYHDFAVHNLGHHILNPRVHIPILRRITNPRTINDDEAVAAVNPDRFPQFGGPLAQVQKLKELPAKLTVLRAGIAEDPDTVELASTLVRFVKTMAEHA